VAAHAPTGDAEVIFDHHNRLTGIEPVSLMAHQLSVDIRTPIGGVRSWRNADQVD